MGAGFTSDGNARYLQQSLSTGVIEPHLMRAHGTWYITRVRRWRIGRRHTHTHTHTQRQTDRERERERERETDRQTEREKRERERRFCNSARMTLSPDHTRAYHARPATSEYSSLPAPPQKELNRPRGTRLPRAIHASCAGGCWEDICVGNAGLCHQQEQW